MDAELFIETWAHASISERAQYQSFISQLCRVLGVPGPDDEKPGDRDYGFERAVRFLHDDGGSHTGFIDCYRRDCFVLEAKQSDKRMVGGALDPAPQLAVARRGGRGRSSPEAVDRLMRHAKKQAEFYAKGLDEWPPFLVIVDVGRSIELWSDFARQGKTYVPFPDRARHRITLDRLRDPTVREMLARVWTDPLSLDPSKQAAIVTTESRRGWPCWFGRSARGRLSMRKAVSIRFINSPGPTRPRCSSCSACSPCSPIASD